MAKYFSTTEDELEDQLRTVAGGQTLLYTAEYEEHQLESASSTFSNALNGKHQIKRSSFLEGLENLELNDIAPLTGPQAFASEIHNNGDHPNNIIGLSRNEELGETETLSNQYIELEIPIGMTNLGSQNQFVPTSPNYSEMSRSQLDDNTTFPSPNMSSLNTLKISTLIPANAISDSQLCGDISSSDIMINFSPGMPNQEREFNNLQGDNFAGQFTNNEVVFETETTEPVQPVENVEVNPVKKQISAQDILKVLPSCKVFVTGPANLNRNQVIDKPHCQPVHSKSRKISSKIVQNKVHTAEESHNIQKLCTICEKYYHYRSLNRHQISVHKMTLPNSEKPLASSQINKNGELRELCTICGKYFHRRSIKRHMISFHEMELPNSEKVLASCHTGKEMNKEKFVKPVEKMKPMEMKTVIVNPVEVKPVEMKTVTVKPIEKVKPGEMKTVTVKPIEKVKPVEMKTVIVKPVEKMQPVEMETATKSCTICHKSFTTVQACRHHQILQHNMKFPGYQRVIMIHKQKRKCDICDRIVSNLYHLRYHQKVMHGVTARSKNVWRENNPKNHKPTIKAQCKSNQAYKKLQAEPGNEDVCVVSPLSTSTQSNSDADFDSSSQTNNLSSPSEWSQEEGKTSRLASKSRNNLNKRCDECNVWVNGNILRHKELIHNHKTRSYNKFKSMDKSNSELNQLNLETLSLKKRKQNNHNHDENNSAKIIKLDISQEISDFSDSTGDNAGIPSDQTNMEICTSSVNIGTMSQSRRNSSVSASAEVAEPSEPSVAYYSYYNNNAKPNALDEQHADWMNGKIQAGDKMSKIYQEIVARQCKVVLEDIKTLVLMQPSKNEQVGTTQSANQVIQIPISIEQANNLPLDDDVLKNCVPEKEMQHSKNEQVETAQSANQNQTIQIPIPVVQTSKLTLDDVLKKKCMATMNFRLVVDDIGEELLRCRNCPKLIRVNEMAAHRASHRTTCHLCLKPVLFKNVVKHGVTHVVSLNCEFCKYVATSKVKLWEHMNGHYGVFPYACQICGEKFKRAPQLRAHYFNRHTNISLHKCEVCGFICNNVAEKRKHKFHHFGTVCIYCKNRRRFSTTKDLKNHLDEVHYTWS